MDTKFSGLPAFIWSVADVLRGDFKQSQYGRVILPFTLLRRLECVLEPSKEKVLDNLETYVQSFSPAAREIFEHFRFVEFLEKLNDCNLLFLLHLISKMRLPARSAQAGDPKEGGLSAGGTAQAGGLPAEASAQAGSRIGIILNDSPLFTGGAGSGESEIRRYILERDLLEAIIALPTDMFYNTGISTYVWVLSNHKPAERKGKVQLINATDMHDSMRKSLGSKRKYLTEEQIEEIVRLYGGFEPSKTCKIFQTLEFGYRRITVERPLQLAIYPHDSSRLESLKADNENVPLSEDINAYFEREVLPHVPKAWIDESKKDEKDGQVGIVGYEIPFNRHFYEYVPPRPLEEIDADLDAVTAEILELLQEVHS